MRSADGAPASRGEAGAESVEPYRYRLRLERLAVGVRLGCDAAERAAEQTVEVSASVHFPGEPAGCRTDRLPDTLSVDALVEGVRAVATGGEFALLEHLARCLHRSLLGLCPPGSELELEVTKVAPPVPGLLGGTRFSIGGPGPRGSGRCRSRGRAPANARERLAQTDPAVFAAISGEERRQRECLELIPSENYTYPEVRAALASALTDKYAEGYPGRRYYAGNTFTDQVENLAQERACRLFRAEHANVQPLSGSPMNQAVYLALLEPGDTILAMDLSHGGHLTHGAPVSHMGRIFRFVRYATHGEDGHIDHDEVLRLARRERPRLVLCGSSSYPRDYDYAAFRRIADEVGALAMADISHVGGLVAGGALANPLDHGFDVLTTTTHKSLRGPRAGLILCRAKHARAIDRSVFPGLQGGPHMHAIAGVAVALGKALEPEFARYGEAVLANAQALARALQGHGLRLVTGGTENHLMVLDTLASVSLDGARAEQALERAGMTCNKQLIPDDPNPPLRPSGVRLGVPAVTTRGMGPAEMGLLGGWIAEALRHAAAPAFLDEIRRRCVELCRRFPIPGAEVV